MSSIYDWSTTAASNATSDGGINWVEGQAPSTVNNSARQMMGRLAELIGDIGGALTAGGTADALTVTANSAFTTYANGRLLAFTAASDNTTAATLNVNSIGAKSIRKMTTSGDSALSGAEIQAGGVYLVQYSTAANAAAGGWILVNPTVVINAATTSASGIVELATDAEAQAKTDTSRVLTPSNLTALGGTSTFAGFLELATDAEAQTGTDTARAITPANLQAVTATTTRKGVSEFATSAEYRVGTDTGRSLVVDQVWGAAAEVTLTDAATIAVDFSTFINAVVTLGGNRALGNPTNEKVGQSGVIRIAQDGTGSRTLSFGTDWEFAGGTAPTLSTAAGANDLLFYHIIATDRIFGNLIQAVA
ncbi:hypothetical protein [Mesorhizobium sp. M4B.F.Ca.ET.143.01.1.1]|uniref:hypothetical protein n=1 Tax=Mesorhizobium sp. M4B.F.Ca.ET.143.01.1.1 TaxID=2563947 RepID=UPI001093BB89|nr:hypothetical protein [Mesorhizobium sp. M4B.F.Ca.ET.143.01.1.1]TGV26330.1 hypothetical protein EN786_12455 [Mesorhizobium sp. M4B.F.Ca.ET.143.01.1.1]